MTHVAKLPGPARILVEDSDGRVFVVLEEPWAGLALVLEESVQMVYEGTVASAAASLEGYVYLVAGGENMRVLRLSIEDAVGFVWIAGPSGLRRIDPDTDEGWLELPPTLSLPPGGVSALARSPNGRALACFASGEVIEIDYNSDKGRAEIAHLTLELLPAPVRAAISDSRGNVWLSVGTELYRREADEMAWQRHWKALNPMPGGNHDIFSVEVGGRLYTAGGVTSGWGYPAEHHWFDELWACDDATGVWEVAGKLQAEFCYNGIATLEQEVWIVGGADNVDEVRIPTGAVQIYDPRTSAWRQGPALNEARMEPVVVTAAGRIYAIGGASANSSPMASVESIGPEEPGWRMENPLPHPMRQFAGATFNGIIYCISKEAGFSYDVQTGIWKELPRLRNMPQAAQVAAHNGEIWVMGGVRIKRTFRYDPAEGEWLPGPDLPTEQSWGSASDLNGRLVLVSRRRNMSTLGSRSIPAHSVAFARRTPSVRLAGTLAL